MVDVTCPVADQVPLSVVAWDEGPPPATASLARVNRWQAGDTDATLVTDALAEEVPVALVYNGISHVVMLATPANLEEFALGFSLTEGIISHRKQIYGMSLHQIRHAQGLYGVEVHIELATDAFVALKAKRRNLVGRTGCGLCGAESLGQVFKTPTVTVSNPAVLSRAAIHRALHALSAKQPLQQQTGATHACAWVNNQGDVLCVREDVGRHNALDKLLGALQLQGIPSPSSHHGEDVAVGDASGWVLTTSRASYEMVQKIAMVGYHALVAMSAPTALAVTMAKQYQVTLVGFARPQQCVVYHGDVVD